MYKYIYINNICNRNLGDDIAGSSGDKRVPGFNDFTSTSKQTSEKKRRLQPVVPRRSRARAFSEDDGMFSFCFIYYFFRF